MSSSPRRFPLPEQAVISAAAPPPEVSAFPYKEVPAGTGPGNPAPSGNLYDAAVAEDVVAHETRARELGRQEGLAEARKSYAEQLAMERGNLAEALAHFTRDRAAYYQKVEAEVVQLALSIARKILHREAQVDPLLLAGIARVALEKIEGATGVVLLVHPQQASDWRRYLAVHLEPGDLPEIIEDPALEPERCVLQTSMGTAELGIEVQLKEIEQGLTDLLAARPRETL
jgi:flagellar assembly protein FliH